MFDLKAGLAYYLLKTYRRKILDGFLEKNRHIYRGKVLDIGGRDRSKFKSPKNEVAEWLIADIDPGRRPDIVMDVSDMSSFESGSFDTVNALELFEHVEKAEEGLRECARILKTGGKIVISMPFLHPIHADPSDFQRWTAFKWKKELEKNGLEPEKISPMGGFFTVLADMAKSLLASLPAFLKYPALLAVSPFTDLLVKTDRLNSKRLSGYTTGYFIVAEKK